MSSPRAQELGRLLEAARHVKLTDADRDAQRRSFAYGNVAIENPRVTRAQVNDQFDELRRSK